MRENLIYWMRLSPRCSDRSVFHPPGGERRRAYPVYRVSRHSQPRDPHRERARYTHRGPVSVQRRHHGHAGQGENWGRTAVIK